MNYTERVQQAIDFRAELSEAQSEIKSVVQQEYNSTEEFLSHHKRVADILLSLNMDENTVLCGVLHDVTFTPGVRTKITNKFGEEVIELLDGVAKISSFTLNCSGTQQADSARKMIFALIDDIRVIIVKLADKLDRMRNLKGVDSEKQRKTAYEAIGIWAPIANRLGISSVKDELEDLSLKFSNPDVFAQIKQIVAQKKNARSEYLTNAQKKIEQAAKENGFEVTVNGRAKHFYSIYQKMRKRNKSADELYDLLAIRILCHSTVHCYMIIGLVHTLWKPVDGRFKDYIAQPKSNGYQSIHTTVECEGKPLEIQIRTFAMHETAENGVASHWLYKKGTNKDSVSVDSVVTVSKMKELGKEMIASKVEGSFEERTAKHNQFFAAIKQELLGESIFVFTPKGDVIELPAGSCAIDFAYAIHSAVGEKITGAKANGQIIPLSSPLCNTQTIEILTNPNAHPTVNQLEQVKTPKARARIRSWLNENDITFAHNHQVEPILPQENGQKTFPHHGQSKEEYLAQSGAAGINVKQQNIKARIKIGDTSNYLFSFAGCCEPQLGDDVVGYVSRGRGIIVHRENCHNVWKIPNVEQRLVQVEWDISEPKDKKKR